LRIVVQRVSSANVKVDLQIVGKIGKGLLVYAGMEKSDTEREIEFLSDKILNLRIFPDEEGKMGKSVLDIDGGAILSVSQFTLASFVKKGRRPDFSNALEPEKAEELYNFFCDKMAERIIVEKGVFGAMMDVASTNDGPVTFILEKNFNTY